MPTADRICPNRKTFSLLRRHVSNVTLTESIATLTSTKTRRLKRALRLTAEKDTQSCQLVNLLYLL